LNSLLVGKEQGASSRSYTAPWRMFTLTACAGRKEFQKGYERGSGDTVKRQYWIQQNMQKAGQAKASPYRLTLYRIPVAPDPNATVKTVPHEIAIPIYE
jgi:hypothetical protein